MNQKSKPTDDGELIRRSLAGERDVFGTLVNRYQSRIYATIYRILGHAEDARDLAQEAFLRAYAKLDSFREGARFSTWLYTIALNLTRSELRRRKARAGKMPLSLSGSRDSDGPMPDPPATAEAPADVLGRQELYQRVLAEMETLDPEAREVVVLRDMQDLSYERIAEVVGCPVGTVRSRLHRARNELRERLMPVVTGRRKGGAA